MSLPPLRQSCLRLATLGCALILVGSLAVARAVVAQVDGCPEPNDDPATACPLASGAVVQSVIDRPGDVDMYRLVVGGGGGQVALDLTELPADYDLYLIDSGGGVLGQSVHEGTAPEQLQLTVQTGTYFAIVQADLSREVDASRPYTLTMTLSAGSGQATAESVGGPSNPPAAQPVPGGPWPACGQPTAMPPSMSVVAPAAGLAQRLAAFGGGWEGRWGGSLPSRLIVEQVYSTGAIVVYAWGDHPQGRFKAGWLRTRAAISPEGVLSWTSSGNSFRFVMAADLLGVDGTLDQSGSISAVSMLRCSVGP